MYTFECHISNPHNLSLYKTSARTPAVGGWLFDVMVHWFGVHRRMHEVARR